MVNHYGDKYSYIWSVNDSGILPACYQKIKTVKYLSIGYIYSVMTAGFIIYNSAVKPWLPLRKTQTVVNTWHAGGAYKKMYLDAAPYRRNLISMKIARMISAQTVKYVLSSCGRFTLCGSRVWAIPPEKFLPIGLPRNDILLNTPEWVNKKVEDYFSLEKQSRIVLFAPTYRGDYRNTDRIEYPLDIPRLLEVLKRKFGHDFVFLYRSHIYASDSDLADKKYVQASSYPDMQELLCAADILITDYSSSIWDFSFTFKPCFLYAPDLAEYKTQQGFYTPIEKWPFPLAETNEQLMNNIDNFDLERYKEAVKQHHADLGSFEKGTACEQFCRFMFA
jgi:CDP-glycerol glycerophosphotransferase